jgi:hypothetical protein
MTVKLVWWLLSMAERSKMIGLSSIGPGETGLVEG